MPKNDNQKNRIVSSLRLSIENETDAAIAASGLKAVRNIFAMFGARSIDDLSEGHYEAALSELILLAQN